MPPAQRRSHSGSPHVLAQDVPKRYVDSRASAHLGAGADEAHVARQEGLTRLDGARVLADEAGGDHGVDVPFGSGGTLEGLAQPDKALVVRMVSMAVIFIGTPHA
jgi:hypothetical protein